MSEFVDALKSFVLNLVLQFVLIGIALYSGAVLFVVLILALCLGYGFIAVLLGIPGS